MEAFTRRHFFHHDNPENCPRDEILACHHCQLRAFPRAKEFPVAIQNELNDETPPPAFIFMKANVNCAGVKAADKAFLSGCTCTSDSDCQYDICQCLDEIEDDNSQKIYAYHTHGEKAGLLRSKYLSSRQPIYECHEGCACSASCPNRVVERGRTIPLQIFRTTNRGWGVRSPVWIRKGQFIDLYLGEVMTSVEADQRRNKSVRAQKKDVYLFALDKFIDPDSMDPRLRGPPLEVDGEFKSGPTRFINHSCEPNLRIFARVGDRANKHLHDLALFAIKDIPRGTELTFDYVDGVANGRMDVNDPALRGEMSVCLCGEESCRGFLW